MKQWKFDALSLKGAYLIKPFYADDNRGGFVKDYSECVFEQNGLNYELKEVFYTISLRGVIRAIHFQLVKQQPKLVRCIKGRIFDAIVDLRKDSPTYKKWLGFYLTEENMDEILVPEGFGHGYLVLEDSIVSYKCSEKFYPEFDSGIKYDDPTIGILWPFNEIGGIENLILSQKDISLPSFAEFEHSGGFRHEK